MADIAFIIASAALLLSTVLMFTCKTILHENREAMEKIWTSLHYVEVAMSYHDMLPLPWEMEDFDDRPQEADNTRKFKRDGNVVFLTGEKDGE